MMDGCSSTSRAREKDKEHKKHRQLSCLHRGRHFASNPASSLPRSIKLSFIMERTGVPRPAPSLPPSLHRNITHRTTATATAINAILTQTNIGLSLSPMKPRERGREEEMGRPPDHARSAGAFSKEQTHPNAVNATSDAPRRFLRS